MDALAAARPVVSPAGRAMAGNAAAPNARAALAVLRERILRLDEAADAPSARLAALEQFRRAAGALHPPIAAMYVGKPIPLEREERNAWQETVDLWLALHAAYAARLPAIGSDQVCPDVAVICRGALACMGVAMREHVRVYHAVPAPLWKQLNALYRNAEIHGALAAPCGTGTDDMQETCCSVYRETVLALAANTYALSPPQAGVALALSARWRDLIEISSAPAAEHARSPHAIDLATPAGPVLVRQVAASKSVRYINAEKLASRLREVAAAVREGASAPELDPTDALPRVAIEKLLTYLYVQWCSAGSNRADERRSGTQRAQVSTNMHSIHFQISGRAFRQPGLRYTREEEGDLATFGHITERTESRLLTTRSSALEPWEIVNQGPGGLLGMNRKPDLQARIGQGQLIAMRTSSAQPPLLGIVQRVREETDGSLVLGVRTIPGEAQGASARLVGNPKDKFERALVIAGDEERKLPATLVLPAGTFKPNAALELATTSTRTVRLLALVEQGLNFERATFEPQ